MQVFELKRGGSEVGVTKDNCVQYIHLMAHYRLNVQLHRQFQAFRSGLRSVIPSHWLSLFNQDELQVLISGAQVPISVDDLRQHTAYAGMFQGGGGGGGVCCLCRYVPGGKGRGRGMLLMWIHLVSIEVSGNLAKIEISCSVDFLLHSCTYSQAVKCF